MASKIDEVARALDVWTENALDTHGRFDTREMARAAIEAMKNCADGGLGNEAEFALISDPRLLHECPDQALADAVAAWFNAILAEGEVEPPCVSSPDTDVPQAPSAASR